MKACLFAAVLCLFIHGGTALAQSEKVFFGNLHSHTSYSDGIGTPREAYRHARDTAKIQFLALTEHSHAQADGADRVSIARTPSLYNGTDPESLFSASEEFTENGRFVALYGQEFSTLDSGNHINVFDISEVITSPNGRFDRLLEFADAKKDSFGKFPVMMFNHPRNTLGNTPRDYGQDDFGSFVGFVRQMSPRASLIQMINGPGTGQPGPRRAASPDEAAFLKYLNIGFKLAPTADQDNHFRDWGDGTEARTGIVATDLTKEKILDALRARHVYASQDKNLSVIIKVNGRLCGDVVTPLPATSALTIDYRISDADEPNAVYELQVFRDEVGGGVATMVTSVMLPPGGGVGQVPDVAFSGSPQYMFFRVKQFNEDGPEDLAWTAPVWFEDATVTPLALTEAIVMPRMVRSAGDPRPHTVGLSPELDLRVPDLDALAAAARLDLETAPAADPAGFVASKSSNVFHVSEACLDSKAISDGAKVSGSTASLGREPHAGCPRLP